MLMSALGDVIKRNPTVAGLPVYVFGDAEGNQIHALEEIGLESQDTANPREDTGDFVLLVPGHEALDIYDDRGFDHMTQEELLAFIEGN